MDQFLTFSIVELALNMIVLTLTLATTTLAMCGRKKAQAAPQPGASGMLPPNAGAKSGQSPVAPVPAVPEAPKPALSPAKNEPAQAPTEEAYENVEIGEGQK